MARFHPLFFATLVCAAALVASPAFGAESDGGADLNKVRAEAAKTFKNQVSPFVTTYCGRCHTGGKEKGGVTFQSALKNPDGPAFRLLKALAPCSPAAMKA